MYYFSATEPETLIALIITCLVLILLFLLLTILVVCRLRLHFRSHDPELRKFNYYPPEFVVDSSTKDIDILRKIGLKNGAFISKSCNDMPSQIHSMNGSKISDILKKEDTARNEKLAHIDTVSNNISTSTCTDKTSIQNGSIPPGLASFINEHSDSRSLFHIVTDQNHCCKGTDTMIILGDPAMEVFGPVSHSTSELEEPIHDQALIYDPVSFCSVDHLDSQEMHIPRPHIVSHYSIVSTDTAEFEAEQANKYLGANNDISVLSQSEMSINVRSCPNSPIVSRTPGFIRKNISTQTKETKSSNVPGSYSEPQIDVNTEEDTESTAPEVYSTDEQVDSGEPLSIEHSTEMSTCF